MKVNLQSQNFRIKTLAQKAESLGASIGKGLAKNKFGSRTVLNLGKSAKHKLQSLKSDIKISKSTAKTSKKEVKITPAIADSLKSSGLM